MASPTSREDTAVSLLTGAREERFALALDGFFGSVDPSRLLSGDRDGTGERQLLFRLLRDFVEGERQVILRRHRQGARGVEIVQDLTDLADVVVIQLYRRT